MNWRRSQIPESEKHRREWKADRGRYRIIWRDRVEGVTVDPGYHANFRNMVRDVGPIWEKVDPSKKRLYRTLNAAKKACGKHRKMTVDD